mmetsp:Transcript_8368/g.37011  ORF Transcript_8368/g.37011 Transcript_8368/m.37011 type:complete len:259 (+) Transcript_8368:1637-2413(+)
MRGRRRGDFGPRFPPRRRRALRRVGDRARRRSRGRRAGARAEVRGGGVDGDERGHPGRPRVHLGGGVRVGVRGCVLSRGGAPIGDFRRGRGRRAVRGCVPRPGGDPRGRNGVVVRIVHRRRRPARRISRGRRRGCFVRASPRRDRRRSPRFLNRADDGGGVCVVGGGRLQGGRGASSRRATRCRGARGVERGRSAALRRRVQGAVGRRAAGSCQTDGGRRGRRSKGGQGGREGAREGDEGRGFRDDARGGVQHPRRGG